MRILLVVYDNDSYIHFFPQGLAAVAAVLKREGCEVEIYNQDVHHYSESHLTEFLGRQRYDVVGLSFIAGYYQYRKALKISEAINRAKARPFYIIGGHGPTPEPEFFLLKTGADAVVMGEGEETVLDLLEAVQGKRAFRDVLGIAYREGELFVVNDRRPLIKEIDDVPLPAYELFPVDHYRLQRLPGCQNSDFMMPMLSGRGCPFKCSFCYRMDEGFRPRSAEGIVEEIKLLKRDYGISYISFSDELFMSSCERTEHLCREFIRHKLDIRWFCNGRLNFAKRDVLNLMKEAGCFYINYGVEAFDDDVLRKMNKALTTDQISRGIEATKEAGIAAAANIIFGNVGDTEETLRKGVEFLLKHHDDGAEMRTIRPVTPYPGSPLYYQAISKGLLRDCGDFYESKHQNSDLLSVNFTDMNDEEFYRCLHDANSVLINDYLIGKKRIYDEQMKKLYCGRDSSFRGFRQI